MSWAGFIEAGATVVVGAYLCVECPQWSVLFGHAWTKERGAGKSCVCGKCGEDSINGNECCGNRELCKQFFVLTSVIGERKFFG